MNPLGRRDRDKVKRERQTIFSWPSHCCCCCCCRSCCYPCCCGCCCHIIVFSCPSRCCCCRCCCCCCCCCYPCCCDCCCHIIIFSRPIRCCCCCCFAVAIVVVAISKLISTPYQPICSATLKYNDITLQTAIHFHHLDDIFFDSGKSTRHWTVTKYWNHFTYFRCYNCNKYKEVNHWLTLQFKNIEVVEILSILLLH